jgi:tRNA nucleotidyltransferase (CCA-adding enzyme)
VLELLENTDALRRPERFESFLLACEADARGRTGLEDRSYPQGDYLRTALAAARRCVPTAEETSTLTGPEIAERLRTRRLEAIKSLRPRT